MPATAERPASNSADTPRDHAARVVLRRSTVQLADPVGQDDGDAAPRRFESVPYSGEPFDYWWGRCVIDLATLRMPESGTVTPLLYDHGATSGNPRIGKVLGFSNDGNRLTAEGEMLSNDAARSIVEDSDQGFPFQQSLGLDIGSFEFVDAGVTVEVNGRTLEGPLEVWRHCDINELSFVVLGADSNTEAAILSRMKHHPGGTMATSTAELAAKAGTTNPTQTDGAEGTAKLSDPDETVKVSDINAEWIQENKPDVAEALSNSSDESDEEMSEGDDPVASDSDKADMTKPATIGELRSIASDAKLSSPDTFVADMAEDQVCESMARKFAASLSKAERNAAVNGDASGALPVSNAGLGDTHSPLDGIKLSSDPARDYESNPALKAAAELAGFKTPSSFGSFAKAQLRKGKDPIEYLKSKAESA